MALIDEYKQAIQDVLDGRAPEAPKPSELPWTEDKAATMWAAAAAELIAEANSQGGGGGGAGGVVQVTIDTSGEEPLGKTAAELISAVQGGSIVMGQTSTTDDCFVYNFANVSTNGVGEIVATFYCFDEDGYCQILNYIGDDANSPLYAQTGG